jgi:signal transduction histidine kinase/ligand-binding sensor domain-containing protein/CheY-like chemotaxis protein/HPt (histidine-containing phosphotransfer) domain-containing protein
LALALALGFMALRPPSPAEAQPRFHHVTVEDGLPQSSVLNITIDTRGFLWIGTYDGLVRHDGYEYRVHHAEPGNPDAISDANIRAVLPDRDGSLWVGTKSGGLNFFDAKTGRFRHYRNDPGNPHSLPHDEVRALCRDPSGLLWVGTFGGLAAFDPAGKLFTTYRQAGNGGAPRAADEILALVPGPGGVLFVGTGAGLFRFDTAAKTFSPMPLPAAPGGNGPGAPGASGPVVASLGMQTGGILWVGTEWKGLFEIDLQNGAIVPHLPGRAVASTFRDSRGGVWAGTDAGLAHRAKAGEPFVMYVHDPLDPMSICGNDIRGIVEDASGILWFGSFTAGLSKLSPKTRAFDLYRRKSDDPRGLSGSEVSAVTMDAAGRLWVGTRDGGITVIDRKAGRRQIFRHDPADPGSLSQDEVTSLLRDRQGRVWAATADNGLNLYDEATGKWKHFRHDPGDPESLSQDKIWYVAETRDGMLWIGTSKGGLNRFDPATGKCRRYGNDPNDPRSISHDRVRHIVEGADGALWIGTNKGLNRFDRAAGTFRHWDHDPADPHSLSNDRVTPIVETPDGELWVGTDNGLNRFNPKTGTFTRFTKADGLINDGIQAILRDETGVLWLSTFKGLSRFDPASGEFRNYTAKDGLQGVEFWMNAAYRDPYSGEMFFGGVKGLNGFFPGEVEKNPHIPPVVVTAISITDSPYAGTTAVDFTSGIELTPSDRGFTVTYAALDFADPSKNQYAHMLEGFDRDFSKPTTRRFVTYTNLDPGDYVLRLRASNDDGIWNDTGTSLHVRVLPPYWKTFWFRLSVLAAAVGAAWLFYRLRLSRVDRKRVELAVMVDERTLALRREIEERKAAEERLREAKFAAEQAAMAKSEFLARMSHEIRTPINIIMGMADLLSESGLTDRQRRYVGSFQSAGELLLSIINDILDFSKIEAGRIELEHTAFSLRDELRRVADLAAFRASGKGLGFSWTVADGVPDLVVGDPARLRQVLMNLLGNALKFTVSGEVRLRVELGADTARRAAPSPGEAFLARFTITDTGIGIPQKVLGDIFDRFTQADVSTSRQYGGTGLGLAICRKLVDLMGGTITVTSEEGRGSEFSFTAMFEVADRTLVPESAVPATPETAFPAGEAVSVDPPAARARSAAKRAAVLLAEDNEANRNVVRLFLADLPVEISVAENGLQAVEEAGRRPFDLVFMDVEMPGMDGLDATRAIREMEARTGRPAAPIIALTAHAFQEHRQQCLEAGCTDFVTKPVGKARLVQVLDTYLPGWGFGQAATVRPPQPGPGEGPADMPLPQAPGDAGGQSGGHVVYIKERLKPIVPVFTRTAGQGLGEMRHRLSLGDMEGVRRGGHSLKGSAATMGFAALEIMGRDIEKAAHDGDEKTVATLLDDLESYLDDFEVRYR